MDRSEGRGIRLAELLGTLSLATDLGMGQPLEHVLRQCLISLRLARRLGLDEVDRRVVYYAALVSWVGCHVDAYEQAKWFGDDTALKSDFRLSDLGPPGTQELFMLRHLGSDRPWSARAGVAARFLGGGRHDAEQMLDNHWRAADHLAERLGLEQRVRDAVEHTFERWDGHGSPHGLRGADISIASRVVNLADVLEVYHRAGGRDSAVAVAHHRRGTQFDPAVVDAFTAAPDEVLADLDQRSTWDAVIGVEPALGPPLSENELDVALEALADFVDVKSPFTAGHSRAVADLAGVAAEGLGWPASQVRTVRRAGLVHDLGRLGVPNTIWDKVGPLSPSEVERVRLHPYLTERMLAYSPGLAAVAEIAVQHHERLDGSGYPRGLTAAALGPPGRLLAAADHYCSRLENRPHRPASSPRETARALETEADAGRLDAASVGAVLEAAGQRRSRRPALPAGLTSREVEVLGLLAQGLTNRQMAARLVLAPKTVEHHVEHIYAKTGTRNRAMATLFATTHGLVRS